MAQMTAVQTAAELQRKKNLGVAPTNAANMAQFNQMKPVTPQAAPKPATGGVVPPMPGLGYSQVVAAGRSMQPMPAQPSTGFPGPMPQTLTATPESTKLGQGMASVYAAAPATPQVSTTPSGGVVPNYFDRNFGGKTKYETDQGNRYLSAAASGDADLISRLEADAKRVGYALPPLPQQQQQPIVEPPMQSVNTPQGYSAPTYAPPVDMSQYQPLTREQIAREAAAKIAAETAKRTTAANQAKQGITTSYDRLRKTVGEDRTLQNVAMQDRLDPFNKRSDFERGMVTMQRERTDREQQEDLQGRLANIDVTLKDYLDATPEQQRAMENELTRQERDYGLQVDNQAYGQYADQRDFGRGVYQDDRNFDRGVYEDDRNFGYQAGQDQIQNDAQYGGVYNGQKTADQTQREWQNRVDYGQVIGVMPNGQKTLQMQQFEQDRKNYGDEWAYKVARDSISDKQWQQEFDEDTRRYGLDYGLRRATEKRIATNQASGGSGGGGNGTASGGVPNSGTTGDPNYPVAGPIKDPEMRSQISAMESLLDSGKMTYDQVVAEINKGVKEKLFNESEAAYLMNIANRYKPKTNPNNPFGLPGIG